MMIPSSETSQRSHYNSGKNLAADDEDHRAHSLRQSNLTEKSITAAVIHCNTTMAITGLHLSIPP